MTTIDPFAPATTTWAPPPAGESQRIRDTLQAGAGCCCATAQAVDGAGLIGQPPAASVVGGGMPGSAPVDGAETSPTGVGPAAQQAARDQSVSADGIVPQARRNLERAWQWGLHLTGGVGIWNEWHADGSSVDVSNYANGGIGSETPEMRAYANEMYELGRAGVTGADGGLLVTHVVYAGMKAGASTGWQWVPVSQPDDITQGHWDHVHVETDSWV